MVNQFKFRYFQITELLIRSTVLGCESLNAGSSVEIFTVEHVFSRNDPLWNLQDSPSGQNTNSIVLKVKPRFGLLKLDWCWVLTPLTGMGNLCLDTDTADGRWRWM